MPLALPPKTSAELAAAGTARAGRRNSPRKPTQNRIAIAFHQMDKNGDGQVSQEELKNYVNEKGGNVTMVEQLIKTLDKSGDGQVSMAEFEDLVY